MVSGTEPRFNFGIDIGAQIFFTETDSFFQIFLMFPSFCEDANFYKHGKNSDLHKQSKSIENLQAYLVLTAPFMMEKIPHTKAKLF